MNSIHKHDYVYIDEIFKLMMKLLGYASLDSLFELCSSFYIKSTRGPKSFDHFKYRFTCLYFLTCPHGVFSTLPHFPLF